MNYLFKTHSHNPIFQEMQELSVRSFRKYLAGDWDVLYIDFLGSEELMPGEWKDFTTWRRLYVNGFYVVYFLWKAGNSILLTGADTLCLQPTELFGTTQQMRMFWGERDCLNGDVIYFPAEMKQETWDVGLEEVQRLRTDWGHIQDLYNNMFNSQNPVPELDPSMNYAPEYIPNPLPESEAKIRHFHSTKGPEEVLRKMREIMARESL
jgi:hypothetical protein